MRTSHLMGAVLGCIAAAASAATAATGSLGYDAWYEGGKLRAESSRATATVTRRNAVAAVWRTITFTATFERPPASMFRIVMARNGWSETEAPIR